VSVGVAAAGYALAFLQALAGGELAGGAQGAWWGAPAAALAPWLLLAATLGALLALAALGVRGEGGRRNLPLAAFAAVVVLVGGGVGGALLMADPEAGSLLFLGLPAGAALVVYVAGLLPLLVVPLAYALTFDRAGFAPGEMEAVVRRAREAAGGTAPGPAE
jgi:hypothetical protein